MVPPALKTTLLNDLARVFAWQPDPAHYFPTPATEKLRRGLGQALHGGAPVCVLTGNAGAGKTLLLQICLADMAGHWAHVAQLSYTSMSGSDILRAVAYAFGMAKEAPSGPQPLAWTQSQLSRWAGLQQASLLVLDEAQNLPQDALSPLLALCRVPAGGRPLLQLLLVGRPALLGALAQRESGAEVPAFGVPDFLPRETAAYIGHRLEQLAAAGRPVMSADVVSEIHNRTQGRPGQINLLCKQLLQTAVLMDNDTAIDTATVAAEADELGLQVASPAPVESAPVTAAPVAEPALVAAPVAPVVPAVADAPAAPVATVAPDAHAAADATAGAPAVFLAPAQRSTKAWRVPAAVSLVLAAVGAAVFLQQAGTGPRPPPFAPGAVTVPPAPMAALATPAPALAPALAPTPAPAPALDVEPLPAAQPHAAEPGILSPALSDHARPPVSTKAPAPVEPAPRPASAGKQLAAVRATVDAPDPAAARPKPPVDARCRQLLAQLSLGEPLSAGQQHTLESTCH